jgi:hypothetical protein
MTEVPGSQEMDPEQAHPVKPQRLQWLLSFWIHPRTTIKKILSYEKGVWAFPLILLSILQVLKNLIEGPIRTNAAITSQAALAAKQAIQNGMNGVVIQAQPTPTAPSFTAGPVYNILLPAILAILGIWVVWILFGSVLHLSLTLAGNRSSATTSLNLMAWASLPFAIRLVVQIIYTLATKTLVSSPGLSGLVPAGGTLASFLSSALACIDIYFVWQIVILILGAMIMGNISRPNAISSVLICALVIIALQAIPGTIMHSISGMAVSRPFFF